MPSYRQRLSELDLTGGMGGSAYGQAADASVVAATPSSSPRRECSPTIPWWAWDWGSSASTTRSTRAISASACTKGPRDAHNLYLGLGADVGVVGLVAFLGIVITLIRGLLTVRRRHRRDPDAGALATALIVSITFLLANGLFLHIAYMRYMWFVFALAAIAVNLDRTAGTARRCCRPRRRDASGPQRPRGARRI